MNGTDIKVRKKLTVKLISDKQSEKSEKSKINVSDNEKIIINEIKLDNNSIESLYCVQLLQNGNPCLNKSVKNNLCGKHFILQWIDDYAKSENLQKCYCKTLFNNINIKKCQQCYHKIIYDSQIKKLDLKIDHDYFIKLYNSPCLICLKTNVFNLVKINPHLDYDINNTCSLCCNCESKNIIKLPLNYSDIILSYQPLPNLKNIPLPINIGKTKYNEEILSDNTEFLIKLSEISIQYNNDIQKSKNILITENVKEKLQQSVPLKPTNTGFFSL